MTGRVNRYNPIYKTGFIFSFTNNMTYRFKESEVEDGDIANGYIVDFHVAFDEELQKKCAKGIRVVDSSAEIYEKDSVKPKKKNNASRKKPCNADRVVKDDKKFRKFAKEFMREQKKAGEQICQNT